MKLDLIKLDREITELIINNTNGLTKSCVRSSIHHLETAWKIQEIDPEMAVFRSITAEEEAATAIFIAVKEKCYKNSNKIKFKNHTYKQGLYPFIRSIRNCITKFASSPLWPLGKNYSLEIDTNEENKTLKLFFIAPNGMKAYPVPPLNFSISMNDKPYYFENEFLEIASGKNKKDIQKYIQEIANTRNRILYAAPEGIPSIDGNIEKILKAKQAKVFTLLRILALIYPYKQKSLFIQQALNSYLNVLGQIELEEEKNA
jgi:hypothetical protein